MGETAPTIDQDQFRTILEHVGESANARTVFGDTVVHGNRAIIPVARVQHMGGGGLGGGGGITDECGPGCPPGCEGGHAEEGYGSGMGLGYRVQAEPAGFIEVTADAVTWVPTIDWNRIAGIGAIAGGVFAVIFALGAVLTGRR